MTVDSCMTPAVPILKLSTRTASWSMFCDRTSSICHLLGAILRLFWTWREPFYPQSAMWKSIRKQWKQVKKFGKKNKGNRKGSWIYGVMAISESNAALSVCQGQTWIIKNAKLARLLGMSGFSVVIWLNMKSNCRRDARQNTKPIVLAESNGYGGWSCNGQRLRDENSRLLDLGWPEHGSGLHFSSLYSIQRTSAVVIGSEWHDR